MKLIKKIIFCILILCVSNSMLAQELTDSEIGLDVERLTPKLQERRIMRSEVIEQKEKNKEKITSQYEEKNSTNIADKLSTVEDIPESEKKALLAFYIATGGDKWNNTIGNKGKWDFNTPVTSWTSDGRGWYGIDVFNGHVTNISFTTDNNLNGAVIDLSALTELASIKLSYNPKLGGNINFIANNYKLHTIHFRHNGLFGDLSSITNLTNLVFFVNTFNKIGGEIPMEISKLEKLNHLVISNTQISGGLSHLGLLTSLDTLEFFDNEKNNKITDPDYNNKEIPSNFSNLINLRYLNLGSNGLARNLQVIGSLKKLKGLVISANNFKGSLPDSFLKLSDLEGVLLSQNGFTDINNLKNSNKISLLLCDHNKLTAFPDFIGNFLNLRRFLLNDNEISGFLPATYLNIVNVLGEFNVQGNKLRFIDLVDSVSFLSVILFLITTKRKLILQKQKIKRKDNR
ncbi:hypothetical protein JJC03_03860 [Flavobacterium oreochromis]|uniref:leucine-rich repeat domain-containing protein n=1 Tax=Flavobacterium oreochromis TaxID=2906078 RepID=UPI001CE6E1A7|nr:hypothetical protein [Flavobacterium oreochromis]QYS87110.1 hypothetical protein JJC03_03860 [Flavobacterium oreochromis]